MSSRIKKLVLYFFLTVSSIFIFLIIASGGFLMTARKTQYAENTILEKDLIRRWKYKGFLFQIYHPIEDGKQISRVNHIYVSIIGTPYPSADSLAILTDKLHLEILQSINSNYRYDSLFYSIYVLEPNENYISNPEMSSPTKTNQLYYKGYKMTGAK